MRRARKNSFVAHEARLEKYGPILSLPNRRLTVRLTLIPSNLHSALQNVVCLRAGSSEYKYSINLTEAGIILQVNYTVQNKEPKIFHSPDRNCDIYLTNQKALFSNLWILKI